MPPIVTLPESLTEREARIPTRGSSPGLSRARENRRTALLAAGVAISLAVQIVWPERAAHVVWGFAAISAGWTASQVVGRLGLEWWRRRYLRAYMRAAGWRERALRAEAQLELKGVLNDVRAELRAGVPE